MAQHYIGYTDDLEQRLASHRNGDGAAIMAAVAERGITWEVVRTWEGNRELERKLKNLKAAPRLLCPVCREDRRNKNGGR